jgi:hypothetical protein
MNAMLPLAAVLVGAAALLSPSAETADARSKPAAPPLPKRSIVHVCPIPRSFDQYVRDSDDVVAARVVAVRPVVPIAGIPYREVDLDVHFSVKAMAPSKLTIDVIGAQTDTVQATAPESPEFGVGEEVALFLLHDASTGHWGILGLSEGTTRAWVDAAGTTRLRGRLVSDESSVSFFDRVLNRWADQPR